MPETYEKEKHRSPVGEVRIAEFNMSENPEDRKWGEPGNQLTPYPENTWSVFIGELQVRPWYGEWTACYRPINPITADKIAQVMEDACRNLCVGYSQYNGAYPRTSFYDELRKAGWNAAEIKNLCNGDCSSGIMAACNAAGIPIDTSMYTETEDKLLMASGQFIRITDAGLINRQELRRRGDIMLKKGHTCCIIDNGDESALDIPLRTTASTYYRSYTRVEKGSQLGALPAGRDLWGGCQRSGKWWIVSVKGQRVWISNSYIEPLAYVSVNTGCQSWIRSEPSINGDRLDLADDNDFLYAAYGLFPDERGVYWYKVLTPDGSRYGYISSKYTKLNIKS